MKEKKIVKRQLSPEETIRKSDLDSFSYRVSRLKEILPFKISEVATLRVVDHVTEAEQSYINGCLRSCIICSSNAVEHSFIHMLIVNSEDWEKAYWEIKIKRMTFGKIIEEAEKRKIKVLDRFIKDARWLRDVRNAIVAHSGYIAGARARLESPDKIIWANKIMLRDLREFLKFFDAKKREQLEKLKLTAQTRKGKMVAESESLKEILANPVRFEGPIYIDWWGFQRGLLYHLALEVYKRMSKIIKGIHALEKSESS